MDKKQKKWLLISIAISVTVLFLFLLFTFDAETLKQLRNINPWFLILAVLMHTSSIIFWALRIIFMSRSLGYKVGFFRCINLVCSNQFVASVTPSQIGGEPVRIYELTKAKVPAGDAAAIVIMERVFDGFVLVIGAVLSIFFLSIFLKDIAVPQSYIFISYIAVIVFSALLVLFVVLAFHPNWAKNLFEKAGNWRLKRHNTEKSRKNIETIANHIDRFYSTLKHFTGKSKSGMLTGLFFTALIWLIEFMLVSVIMMGLGLKPHFLLTIIFMILVTVILMIPLTPGSAGIAEVSMAGFFSLIVPTSLIGVFVLIWRLIIYYFNIITGFIATMIIVKREAKSTDADDTNAEHQIKDSI